MEPVRVNREHIPYEFPRGKDDIRFYHPMKGGRSENIPGRKDASTEFNYARDALEELWGGEGRVRIITFFWRFVEIKFFAIFTKFVDIEMMFKI